MKSFYLIILILLNIFLCQENITKTNNASEINDANDNSTNTTNTTEVSTKDHGDYPAVIAQSVSWEVQCENLYTDANEAALISIQTSKTPVTITFCKVSNYDANDEKGIVPGPNTDGDNSWTPGATIISGQAYLTSFQVNAPAGDNATISCTFTGNGAFQTS